MKHRYNITEQIEEQCLKTCALYKKENVEKEWHTRGKKEKTVQQKSKKNFGTFMFK